MIELKNISKRFGRLTVLDQINLTIPSGEITTLIGKSGMGKTVILKHIIGLIEPDSGQILFEGQDLTRLAPAARRAIKRKFGFMFQNVALFDAMTVYDNIALPLRENTQLTEAEIKTKVTHYLQHLEINAIALKYPAEISGGMKKRVGLARVLVTEPAIILFDEPTAGLDPIRKYAVHDMIAQMHQQLGFTAIVVSHDIPDIFMLSDQVVMLDQGKIIFKGTPDQIQRCTHSLVQEFVRGSRKGPLTGFDEPMAVFEQFEACLSGPPPNALISLKIHALEQINQHLGYAAKQQLCQHFSELIRGQVNEQTLVVQYAHNQIIILLPNTPDPQAQQIIQAIQTALHANPPRPKSTKAPAIACQISASSLEITPDLWVLEEAVAKLEARLQPIMHFTLN